MNRSLSASRTSPRYVLCSRGFTLIEMVIVLAILAVLSTIAIPRFSDAAQNNAVEQAARRLAADLRLAQSNAIKIQQMQSVAYDTTLNTYNLVGMTHPDHPSQPYTIDVGAVTSSNVRIFSANFGGSSCQFDRYGSPATPGTVVLTLGTRSRTIRVSAGSGRVSIE